VQRSALLLGKAQDNNASCAIGPFIRLFDGHFGLDQLRHETVHLQVAGDDGYTLRGINTMASISRDPVDLVAQTLACHLHSPWLGCLLNRVTHCEAAPPWRFGLRAFIGNLAERGLLQGSGCEGRPPPGTRPE
jgi:fumarylacetoacetate (FAA) hydrolase family protein